jgi:hypothetical protein
MPHHVDNVLPSKFWNKSWLEQSLEQEKPCRIKELQCFVPVFQCSDQENMVWESENKNGQVVRSILRVQSKNPLFPLDPQNSQNIGTNSFRPPIIIIILYILYI